MPTFICSMSWTDQGIRTIEDAPKRRRLARKLAGELDITIKDIYVTSGDSDLLFILEAPDGDSATKFALTVGSQGNVRTRTARAFTEAESEDLMAEVSKLRKKNK